MNAMEGATVMKRFYFSVVLGLAALGLCAENPLRMPEYRQSLKLEFRTPEEARKAELKKMELPDGKKNRLFHPLGRYQQPSFENGTGATAAQILLKKIQENPEYMKNETVKLQGNLVFRESTAPPRSC